MDLEHRIVDDGDDVVDPAGGGDEDYETTMSTLVELCSALAGRLGS
jgi:protein-tyrosine-phosphatase